MYWHFKFTGAKAPLKPQRGCLSCLAALGGVCTSTQPPHYERDPACQLCHAAASRYCESHGRGLAKALDDFAASLDETEAELFMPVMAAIEAWAARVPEEKHIEVEAHEYEDLPDMVPRGLEMKLMQARE
jgi:hypothetical protein